MNAKLSPEAGRLFKKIVAEWTIEDNAGRFLLETALTAFDEMKEAQKTLASEGVYIKDRFKQLRLHPAAQREKEARAHMLGAFKQLGLDLDSLGKDTAKGKA